MPRPNKSNPSTVPNTFYIGVPLEKAHTLFRELGDVQSDAVAANGGRNSYLDEFLHIMNFMASHKRSFTLDDVFQNSKGFDIPAEVVRELFGKYVEFMEKYDKLTRISGCYNVDIFSWN
jgi:hypothetical protein